MGRDLSGSVLDGRYRLLSLRGEGGMGQVYEGMHLLLKRRVAVKVLPEKLSEDARFRARFVREARAASKIAHLNVVQVLDFGESPEGPAYIVMEFLEGRDLRHLLRKSGRLAWPRARHILLQAVSALKAAHAHDIVHRDIKPGNCFVLDLPHEGLTDVVKLLDFGIAKVLTDLESDGFALVKPLTGTGEIMGTASYMAPEQARGEPLDARSDIYSLGIMAYEMLTGRVPFVGASPLDVISRHLHAPPPPLRRAVPEILPEILPEVEAVVLRTLEKDPRDRFTSMAELETALMAIPGPSLPTVRSRVASTSGAHWGAVPKAKPSDARVTSGPHSIDRFQRTAELMATEPAHHGATSGFGPLQVARDARPAEPKRLRVDDGGSDDTIAAKAAAPREPAPARPRPVANNPPSQVITKVRVRAASSVGEVDPAAETAMDPSLRPQAAVAEGRERPKAPRPSSKRQRPQGSKEPSTKRRSKGAMISRLLGVVILLGSGLTLASMTMQEREGRPAATSKKEGAPAEAQATIASTRAPNSAPSRAPAAARVADAKPAVTAAAPPADLPKAVEAPGPDDTELARLPESAIVTPPSGEEENAKIDRCKQIRRRAQIAEEFGDHPAMLRHTDSTSCWRGKYHVEYLRLRTEALYEENRSDECVRLGEGSTDAEVRRFVGMCRES